MNNILKKIDYKAHNLLFKKKNSVSVYFSFKLKVFGTFQIKTKDFLATHLFFLLNNIE